MILKKSIEINFLKPISKIGFLSIAYQNTVVFTRIDKVGFAESIVHANSKGQLLYELSYNSMIGHFGLLESKKVIIANTANNTIDIIDLQKREVNSRLHNFINDNVLGLDILCFLENSIVAIAELNTNRKNQQLTFYDLAEDVGSSKQISMSLGQRQVHFQKSVVKLNDKSKLAIYQRKNTVYFVFDVYELMQDKTVNQFRVKIEMSQNLNYFYLEDIWQAQQDNYLIFGSKCMDDSERVGRLGSYNRWTSSKNYEPAFIMLKADGLAEERYWFITEQMEENKWSIYKIIHLKHILVLKCTTVNEKSPTYYIDTTGQTNHITDFDNCCTEKGKLLLQYNELEYLQAQLQQKDTSEIKITSKMMATKKEVLLHFMLFINEDFDDDLLQDALELLEEEFF